MVYQQANVCSWYKGSYSISLIYIIIKLSPNWYIWHEFMETSFCYQKNKLTKNKQTNQDFLISQYWLFLFFFLPMNKNKVRLLNLT